MKLIKSISSILLALSVISCNIPFVFAEGETATGTEVAVTETTKKEALANEAEQLLTVVLGRAPRGVTRAGFISDVAELAKLTSQTVVTPYFTDLPSNREEAAGVHAAVDAGLISGGDTFRPDDRITVNEATKVVVTALGYEQYAQICGGWPSGYAAAADKADVFRNVTRNGTELSVEDAKILLMNMLNSRKVELRGNVVHEVGDTTMLEEKYGMYRTAGILTRTEIADLYETGIRKSQQIIQIGETSYGTAEGSDYTALLGYSVTAYYNEDNEVVLLSKTEKNKTVTFSVEDTELTGNSRIVHTGINKEYRYDLNDEYAFIYNGGLSERRLADLLETVSGTILMIDNDDDEEYDVVSMMSPTFVTVKSISKTNKLIYDENTAENTIDMSEEDGNFYINGKNGEIRFIDISAGETYEIYASEDDMLITANLVTNNITGKVESVSAEEIKINGVTYETTAYFNTYYRKALKSGSEGSFNISSGGKLINFTSYGTGLKYGYITYASWDDGGQDYQMVVKIYTQDAESERFTITGKIRVDGTTMQINDLYDILVSGGNTNEQLVRYSADEENRIKTLDFAELNEADELGEKKKEDNSLTEYKFAENKFYYKDTVELMYPYFNVSGTTVFVIPNDLRDEEVYKVTNSSFFTDAEEYEGNLKVYNVSESGTAEVVVIKTDQIAPKISKYTNAFVVEKVLKEVNEDGDVLNKVYGWFDNKYYSYFIDDSISIIKASGEYLGFGDVIRVYVDGDTIKTMICDFDANENVFGRNETTTASEFNGGNRDCMYQLGKAYSITDGFIYLGGGTDGTDMSIPMLRNFAASTSNIVIVDMEEKSVRTGTAADIRTYKNSGDEADTVLIKQRNLATQNLIVYVR